MERRSSFRQVIQHAAFVHLDGGAKWPCTITDFCTQGMLLSFTTTVEQAIKAGMSTDSESSFAVSFKGPDEQPCQLQVVVARLIGGAAGVQFVADESAIVNALMNLSEGSRSSAIPRQELKPILDSCAQLAQQFAQPLMQTVQPLLASEVEASALNASTDQRANMLMELSKRIMREGRRVQTEFLQSLNDPVMFLRKEYGADQEMSDRLSLIGKGEFEHWLTSRVLITKAESLYRQQLLPLKTRLDALGLGAEQRQQSPFGPELFVLAFRSAIQPFTEDGRTEKLLFSVFEKHFMQSLEPCYVALNELLVKHGVLPELDLRKQLRKQQQEQARKSTENEESKSTDANQTEPQDKKSTETPTVEALEEPRFRYGQANNVSPFPSALDHSVTATTAPFSHVTEQGSDEAFQQNQAAARQAYENVLGLVRSLHANDAGQGQSRANIVEKYSSQEVSEGLASLQAASLESSEAEGRSESLLDRVLENLSQSQEGEKGIHQEQQVAIDVVDRFFASLKHNPRLSQNAKQQLNRLEIPVLKVLLKDENFFGEQSNSVREVMNRIAQLGAAGSRLSPQNQSKVESLVQQILQNFEQDTSVFDRALETLNELTERQNQLYHKNVERVASAAEGVHRVEQAKLAVATELNQRLAGRQIPKAVNSLLENGWRDLLNLLHIKHGGNSEVWNEHLEVLDSLIQFSDSPETPLDMKALLQTIQAGLKTISASDAPSAVVRDELKALFSEAPNGRQEMVEVGVESLPETEDSLEEKNARKLGHLKPWVLRAKAIAVGSWIEFKKDDKPVQYMRLVWIAQGYSKFVFVNHQGMKVTELGLFKCAAYLKDGVITPDPLYEEPIVKQGLDDMVKDVYEKMAYDSCHDPDSGLMNRAEFCRQVRHTMGTGMHSTPCCLLYVRVVEYMSGLRVELSQTVLSKLTEILESVDGQEQIVSRLNGSDFVVFSVTEDLEMLNLRCSEQLSLFKEERSGGSDVRYKISESRAHLGFNNPESMIGHAVEPLGEVFDEDFQTDEKILTDSAERVAAPKPSLPPLPEAADDFMTEVVPAVEIKEEQEPVTPSALDDNFDIYCQRSVPLAEKAQHADQYELVCSKAGTGLLFEPESEAQAQSLDQWWLERLVSRTIAPEPEWDGLDTVRVKLSGYALNDDRLTSQLIALSDQGSLDASQIWFDVYDSAAIENVHAAADRMLHLSEKGYKFCLDQFGSSQAPFRLLKALPAHLIKIDEAYIGKLNTDDSDETDAESIVEVAHYLGKEVLASSVDTAICLQRMKRLGIDYAQGSTIAEYERLVTAS